MNTREFIWEAVKKRLLAGFLAAALLAALGVLAAAAEEGNSGIFGNNGDWAWELNGGTLTITAPFSQVPQDMPGFVSYDDSPWNEKKADIKRVEFEPSTSGSIRSIGVGAFLDCSNLMEITLPENLTAIRATAFANTGLTEITLPKNLTFIGYHAFAECVSLTEITLPGNLTTIEHGAFANCTGLTSVTFTSDTPPTIGAEAFMI